MHFPRKANRKLSLGCYGSVIKSRGTVAFTSTEHSQRGSFVARTIDATRQAVIDVRSCVDWLEQENYESIGIVGTSLGSCYAFLASTHDPRLRVNVSDPYCL